MHFIIERKKLIVHCSGQSTHSVVRIFFFLRSYWICPARFERTVTASTPVSSVVNPKTKGTFDILACVWTFNCFIVYTYFLFKRFWLSAFAPSIRRMIVLAYLFNIWHKNPTDSKDKHELIIASTCCRLPGMVHSRGWALFRAFSECSVKNVTIVGVGKMMRMLRRERSYHKDRLQWTAHITTYCPEHWLCACT